MQSVNTIREWSMRRTALVVGIIAIAFLLAACTSDLPDTPKFYEYCYVPKNQEQPCVHLSAVGGTKEFCESEYIGGTVAYKSNCEDVK